MKKYLLYVFGAISVILISLSLMDVSGDPVVKENEIPVIKLSTKAKAFQIGAFESKEKAYNLAQINEGIVISQNNLYYVYKAVLTINTNINRMNKILKEHNINFYIKDIEITESFSQINSQLEESMLQTTSDVAFLTLNIQNLKKYEESL